MSCQVDDCVDRRSCRRSAIVRGQFVVVEEGVRRVATLHVQTFSVFVARVTPRVSVPHWRGAAPCACVVRVSATAPRSRFVKGFPLVLTSCNKNEPPRASAALPTRTSPPAPFGRGSARSGVRLRRVWTVDAVAAGRTWRSRQSRHKSALRQNMGDRPGSHAYQRPHPRTLARPPRADGMGDKRGRWAGEDDGRAATRAPPSRLPPGTSQAEPDTRPLFSSTLSTFCG